MHIQIHRETRRILASGHFPTSPDDPAVEVVDLDDAQAAVFAQPGDKYLREDGTVEVRPLTSEQQASLAETDALINQRAADLAALQAHPALPDDVKAILGRLLGA